MMGLAPELARLRLGPVGQRLYDAQLRTIWEHDTETLPRALARARRRYRDFAAREIAPLALQADRDPSSVDSRALFLASAREGFQTEMMPAPWGGLRLRSLRHPLLQPSLKAEEFCAACGGLGLGLLAHELGIAPLFVAGDVGAYTRWLRQIYNETRRGEPAIAAFAITEPGAGSDVEETEGAATARLGTWYQRAPGGYRISGRKCFISNGAVARWITLFAAESGHGLDRWTCFLLDSGMQGLSVGRSERKMGQRGTDASELVLEDVFVPAERVIGGEGSGWAICRNVLNFSRPVVGAIALGIARGAFEHASSFCRETRMGGRLLTEYQDVQLALSDMLIRLSAMRAMVWQAARYPLPFQASGAAAKVFCSDTAWSVCNDAMALMGDHGYLHIHHVEKAARDARLTQIYEGTNQINRLAVFEGQRGAEFC